MSQAERSFGKSRLEKSVKNTHAFFAEQLAPIFDEQMVHIRRKDPRGFYPPVSRRQTEEDWVRASEITGLRVLAGTTFAEIGKRYGLTRQGVHQIATKTIQKLHAASPQDVKNRHPLDSLGLGKPMAGEKRAKVQELVGMGKSAREIRREVVLTGGQLADHRFRLKKKGILVPYEKKRIREAISRLKTQDLPDEEVQEILNQITIRTYSDNSVGESPVFKPIKKLAKDAGLTIPPTQVASIAQRLTGLGIPIRKIEIHKREKPGRRQTVLRYYFTLSRYSDRVIGVLKSHTTVDR